MGALMRVFGLLSLGVAPFAVWWYARMHTPRHIWLLTWFALGLIIGPFSEGLWAASFWVPPLGIPMVVPAVASTLFHVTLGLQIAEWLRIVPPKADLAGLSTVFLASGVIWAVVYGTLGFIVDWVRSTRSRRCPKATAKRAS